MAAFGAADIHAGRTELRAIGAIAGSA